MEKSTLGETISALRIEKSISQRQIAEKMNRTQKTVSKWEKDLLKPNKQALANLSEILGVSVEVFKDVKQLSTKAVPVKKTLKILEFLCDSNILEPICHGVAFLWKLLRVFGSWLWEIINVWD